MIINATTMTLEAVLAGAVATAQPRVVVSYSELDEVGGALTPAPQRSTTNNTTPVTILSAPASTKERIVDSLSVYNKDTADVTVTVQLNDNGTVYEIKRAALTAGETLFFTRGSGWG